MVYCSGKYLKSVRDFPSISEVFFCRPLADHLVEIILLMI